MKQALLEIGRMPGWARSKPVTMWQKRSPRTGASQTHHSAPVVIAGVTLSHPDRVYWGDAGITKHMLADHYAAVWDWMRPHVTGRVLALVRCPEGIAGQCFFQKHASAGIDTTHLHLVREPNGDRSISIDSLKGLIALVQAGVLEIHLRGSTVSHLEDANRLVFDLDPGPGVEWSALVAAAREVRQRLRDRGLESFVKATGGKGVHVVAPIRFAPWDAAKDFCRRIAAEMAADDAARYTATAKKSARSRRVFVDYLRNTHEATAIAPYSTRARPGATVAVPLSWEELGTQRTPNNYTVLNLTKRLARLREDPWQAMNRLRQRLPSEGPRRERHRI